MKAKIFWLTGLSGAGKSTVCEISKKHFESLGKKVSIVDGDAVREKYHANLGFEFEDVKNNNLLICKLIEEDHGTQDIVLVPVIAPYEKVRQLVQEKLGANMKLVFCNASLESVAKRDVKGLYKKAEAGLIKNMIGFSHGYAYDIPTHPDLTLHTGVNADTPEQSAEKLNKFIQKNLQD